MAMGTASKIVLALLLWAAPLSAQSWRTALTAGASTSLWIDYSQISYGAHYGVPTLLFGWQLTQPRVAAVNAAELAVNVFAPRKVKPWINAITLVGHIPFLIQWSKRPIGVLQKRRGQEVLHIGFRFWP